MSDDRRDDEFREYGSLFDDSPSDRTDGGRGADDSLVDEFDQEWDDEGFGDVTWADDGPAVVDSTVAENYEPPSGLSSYDRSEGGVSESGRVTGMFDSVDSMTDASNLGNRDDDSQLTAWTDEGRSLPGRQSEEIDVWSSFNSESPKWDEDGSPIDPAPRPEPRPERASGRQRRVVIEEDTYGGSRGGAADGGGHADAPESGADRIRIGTDPSQRGRQGRPGGRSGDRRSRAGADGPRRSTSIKPDSGGRDLPMAIGVGLVMVGVFVATLRIEQLKYWALVGLVTLIVGVAAVEFLSRVSDKGYRPAMIPGVATCVAAPLVAYWMGDAGLPLVLSFGFIAVALTFIGASSVDSAPMPNVAITNVGIMWIGLLGSFAMLILRFSTANGSSIDIAANYGTDTLFLVALGVVANDTGALLVGSTAGRTPLRSWISPNKTVEGLMGGAFVTIVAMIIYRQVESSPSTWTSYRDLLILALTISVMAPLGDLVESMFKRNMDIKDFGAIVPGHGGVLDRFDGFLFTLPAVYYVTEVLQPWTKVGP